VQPREYMDQIVVNKSTFPDNEAMLRLFKQESLVSEEDWDMCGHFSAQRCYGRYPIDT